MPASVAKSRKAAAPFETTPALLRAFDTNDKINLYLLDGLPPDAWRAQPPSGRDVASIFAHMHNVRLMWLKATAKGSKIPDQLDRHSVTVAQAKKAFPQSAAALRSVMEASFTSGGKVKGFPPDVMMFFAYLIAHDSHHRGQITMLARQLGYPVPQEVMFGMWEWNTRAKE